MKQVNKPNNIYFHDTFSERLFVLENVFNDSLYLTKIVIITPLLCNLFQTQRNVLFNIQ